MPRHLLTGAELDRPELERLLARAAELKAAPHASRALEGRAVALVFERPSTRTRLSFEAGVVELGGHPMVLRSGEMQLSRGESVGDTARILSRHVAAVGVRTGPDAVLEELAAQASIPVFNMLTAGHHPCQALADLLTLQERFGRLEGLRVAYVGDGNNVARSLALLGRTAGLEVVVSSPAGYELEAEAGAELVADPAEAVAAPTRSTPTCGCRWATRTRPTAGARASRPTGSTTRCSTAAAPGAVALHCLPAHPGEEITAEVLYGDREAIWDQAENRRHAQKALLEWLVAGLAAPDGAH